MRTMVRSKILFLFMAFGVMVATAAVAFADNLIDDLDGESVSATINAGGTFTNHYWIVANGSDNASGTGGSDPQSGCNASDATPAHVTINAPADVTVTYPDRDNNPLTVETDMVFTQCKDGSNNNSQAVTFSSNKAGTYTLTATVNDTGVGDYNTNPASFTLVVGGSGGSGGSTPPADTTAPVITPNVVGTLGNNGWYTSDVDVSWSVVDNESAISSSTGCTPTTISADTTGTTLTCEATSAGGTSSKSVTIKRDATAPVILDGGSVDANGDLRLPNGDNGWFKTAVLNNFTASDATSGLADSTKQSFEVSSGTAEGSAVEINSGPVSDNAGNTNPGINSAAFMIDLSLPQISFYSGAVNVCTGPATTGALHTVTDAISGVASQGTGTLTPPTGAPSLGNVYSYSVVGARDIAGHTNSANHDFVANSYGSAYTGLLQPINAGSTPRSVFKLGSTVPLKFKLMCGTTPIVNAVANISLTKVDSMPDGSVNEAAVDLPATTGTQFRYDSSGQQYIYNLSTKPLTQGTYNLKVDLGDGSDPRINQVYFDLKK